MQGTCWILSGVPGNPGCLVAQGQSPWERSLPANATFSPGFDQVVCDGDRRWHTQVRMVAPECGEHLSTWEPPHIRHLPIVYANVGGQGAGMTADHQ